MEKGRRLTAAALSIGVVNMTTGKTQYDWSIYEDDKAGVFLTSGGYLLFASPGSFEIGDSVLLRNNDTNRKLQDARTIIGIAKSDYESVMTMLEEHGWDYRPIRAFKKRKNKSRLSTSYSIKGIVNGHVAKVYN